MLRVRLRVPRKEDEASVNAWLPEAIAAVAGRSRDPHQELTLKDFLDSLPPNQCLLMIEQANGGAIGLAVLASTSDGSAPDGSSVIIFLAIAAQARNRGLGTEAVLALEARNSKRPLTVAVPLANGLAIYFWLRIGYRPLYPREPHPSPSTDSIWLEGPPGLPGASQIDS